MRVWRQVNFLKSSLFCFYVFRVSVFCSHRFVVNKRCSLMSCVLHCTTDKNNNGACVASAKTSSSSAERRINNDLSPSSSTGDHRILSPVIHFRPCIQLITAFHCTLWPPVSQVKWTMRLWFARDIWRYRNVFWLIDWLTNYGSMMGPSLGNPSWTGGDVCHLSVCLSVCPVP